MNRKTSTPCFIWLLTLGVATTLLVSSTGFAQAIPGAATRHPQMQDPAVPMLGFPTDFRSRRVNSDQAIPAEGSVDLAKLTGPGCIRHIWILPGDDVRLVIHVDGASEPQIDVPLKPFFGVMHDLPPYFIDCAAYSVLPNPAKGIPGTPGYNLYLPIPFAKSCRVSLVGPPGQRAVAMTDWHQYDASTPLTPYRLHAQHQRAEPAPERGGFIELAEISGDGFLAGVAVGYIQQNHTDMVFHTGGMTMLIDGETEPYVIRGHNVEDDFGFTWGFNDRQSRWIGCPWHVNRGRNDQDGVFYRFFGPDPVRFRSSMLFRTGSRGDDMESMVYYYRRAGSTAADLNTPSKWQAIGLFPAAKSWEAFQAEELPDIVQFESAESIPAEDPELIVEELAAARGWIDLQHLFFQRHHTATPLTVLNKVAYLTTDISRAEPEQTVLRLALDDWAKVWLNGEKIAALNHDGGLAIRRIPIRLKAGENRLVIKTNNTDRPLNKRMWAIHAALEAAAPER